MSILDKIIGVVATFDCLACGAEGELICRICLRNLPPAQSSRSIYSVTVYNGIAKYLIWKLKSDGAQAAAKLMASLMAKEVPPESKYLIVPIPTATGRVRQRGYDQSRLLARQLSKQTGLPRANCLARYGQAHQVGANRAQRLRQLSDTFRITRPTLIRNKNILLVDDVVTTGATLQAAAWTLRKAGAAQIAAITFAQTTLRM